MIRKLFETIRPIKLPGVVDQSWDMQEKCRFFKKIKLDEEIDSKKISEGKFERKETWKQLPLVIIDNV